MLHMNMQRSDLNTISDTLPQRSIARNLVAAGFRTNVISYQLKRIIFPFSLLRTPQKPHLHSNRRSLHSQMQTLAYARPFVFCHRLLRSATITAHEAGNKVLGGST